MDKGKVKDDLVAMYKSASVDPTGVKYIADKQAEKTDSQQLAAELGFMCASTMVEAVQVLVVRCSVNHQRLLLLYAKSI